MHCNLLLSRSHLTSKLTSHPLHVVLSYDRFTHKHKQFVLNVSVSYKPLFYHQAIQFDHWKVAMNEEIAAMERTHRWSIVPLPHGSHAIGCKWIYKAKHKADGSIDIYKARLVANGYSQQEGVDFLDTFSPVVKIVTVKLLLSLIASFNWPLIQMDVNNAFLNGDFFEEVFMALPVGYYFDFSSSNAAPMVCKLHKSIYGLKQASRQWFHKFSTVIVSHGFTQSKADYSLFTRGVVILL